jgi:hypothetical protein
MDLLNCTPIFVILQIYQWRKVIIALYEYQYILFRVFSYILPAREGMINVLFLLAEQSDGLCSIGQKSNLTNNKTAQLALGL